MRLIPALPVLLLALASGSGSADEARRPPERNLPVRDLVTEYGKCLRAHFEAGGRRADVREAQAACAPARQAIDGALQPRDAARVRQRLDAAIERVAREYREGVRQ
jgi:hypothetical protein